jgi:hypothetical protein
MGFGRRFSERFRDGALARYEPSGAKETSPDARLPLVRFWDSASFNQCDSLAMIDDHLGDGDRRPRDNGHYGNQNTEDCGINQFLPIHAEIFLVYKSFDAMFNPILSVHV